MAAVCVWEWSSHFNPIGNLRIDLNITAHHHHPFNLAEFQNICNENRETNLRQLKYVTAKLLQKQKFTPKG